MYREELIIYNSVGKTQIHKNKIPLEALFQSLILVNSKPTISVI